ncbi:MAG TPA: N-acetylmuramoyl-L-alanine amidase [Polyangia bacterium]|nr:N-acetylmuramoyl-L-alanine amidase [Polyangia bacterium]
MIRASACASLFALGFLALTGAAVAGEPSASPGSSIIVAGQPFEVGRPVVLWNDPQGFDAYQIRCIDQSGGCCNSDSKRYGTRKNVNKGTLEELQQNVSQFVLHFDGCVNSRSCFKSMHNRPRPSGEGCGLSAHFMIDADGTIYQTLDLVERAFHAEEVNSISIGAEICNRGRVDRSEWPKLPPDYRTRPTRDVVVNGEHHEAYEFRPEQYDSIVALTRTLLRVFPRIKPVIPERDGQPIMDTLADPLSFAGILGHLNVDLQKQKWDPGALDWRRILRALNGFEFPVQIRSFTEIPREQQDLISARRAAFFNAEERATGQFPASAGRLWHSGAHLRAAPDSPVRAPTRGRIIAARRAQAGNSSRSFVLIRHDIDVDGEPLTFYSLIAHLALPPLDSPAAQAIPWLQALAHGPRETQVALEAGQVVVLDQRVEAGDSIGTVGTVSRGPEQGPEIHFEIFTTDRLTGEFGRTFRYINAAGDGPIVRRSDVVAAMDSNGDQQLDGAELRRFFRSGDLDKRQALRRLAIRHRHEWGDRTTSTEFSGLRELAGLSEAQRRQLYDIAIAPYIFWTDELSRATGLPANQTIYSYNPLTFMLELAARTAHVELPKTRGREIGEAGSEPRKLAHVPLTDWTQPQASPIERPLLSAPIGMRLGPRKREDIPLIELAPTDTR